MSESCTTIPKPWFMRMIIPPRCEFVDARDFVPANRQNMTEDMTKDMTDTRKAVQ